MNTQQPELLQWDTELFGYPVYKVTDSSGDPATRESILGTAKEKGARVLYWFSDNELSFSDSIDAKLADIKVDFVKQIDPNVSIDEHIESYAGKTIDPSLLSLAFASGKDSRFKVDQHFKNGEFEKLYRIWLERSVTGAIADDVLVYRRNSEILGFVTVSYIHKENAIRIGLIAVDENSRGMQIGSKLLEAVSAKGTAEKLNTVKVYTQQFNEMACKFYEKNGYKADSKKYIYHIWFN